MNGLNFILWDGIGYLATLSHHLMLHYKKGCILAIVITCRHRYVGRRYSSTARIGGTKESESSYSAREAELVYSFLFYSKGMIVTSALNDIVRVFLIGSVTYIGLSGVFDCD